MVATMINLVVFKEGHFVPCYMGLVPLNKPTLDKGYYQNKPKLKWFKERSLFSAVFLVEQSYLPLRKVNKRKKKQVRKTSIQKL